MCCLTFVLIEEHEKALWISPFYMVAAINIFDGTSQSQLSPF